MFYIIRGKTNKNKFIAPSGKLYAACSNIRKAHKVTQPEKALNIIKHYFPKEREEWEVVSITDNYKIIVPSLTDSITRNQELNSKEILDTIENLKDIQNNLLNTKNFLSSELSNADLELSDFYHFVLNEKVNTKNWLKMLKPFKQLLQRRSKIKEDLRNNNIALNRLSIVEETEQNVNREYKPRTEFYENLKKI